MSDKKLLPRGLASGVVNSVGMGSTFLTSFLLAELVGVDQFGVYSLTLSAALFVFFPFQYGLQNSVLRACSRLRSGDDGLTVNRLVKAFLLVAVASGACLAGLCMLALGLMPMPYSEELIWGVCCSFVILLIKVVSGIARGSGMPLMGQVPDALVRQFLFLLMIAFVGSTGVQLKEDAASTALTLHLTSALFALFFGFLLIRPILNEVSQREIDSPLLGGVFVASLPLMGVGALQAFSTQLDIILLGLFVGDAAAVGSYKLALQLNVLLGFPLFALNMLVAPKIASMHAALHDRSDIEYFVQRVSRISVTATILLYLQIVFLMRPLLDPLVSFDTESMRELALIVGVGQLVNSACGPVGVLLTMANRDSVVLRSLAIAAFVNVAANLSLIPVFDARGAALATVLSFTVWNLLLVRSAQRELGITTHVAGLFLGAGRNR